MKKLMAVLVGAGLALASAPAFTGEWRLDARRCPDIREDWRDARENRRDERYDYSRRDVREDRYDRREDRRDRAFTVCPRSAFYYVSDYGRRDRGDYEGRGGYERGYRERDRHYAPRLPVRYDRRVGMKYTMATGRRIYLRG